MSSDKTYVDGSYFENTGGTWHLEDSPFKAAQVVRMIDRHPEMALESVCDIGCGAGGVVSELERHGPASARFVGYEMSPQAYALTDRFVSQRCEFVLGSPFDDKRAFDLALVLDVMEHVEDCFAFLRQCSGKAAWKMYHIPLDAHASGILRGLNSWDSVAHLHLFTMETARKTIEHSGQEIVDWFLTPAAIERPKTVAARVMNIFRRLLPEKLGARLVGGYSIMILAR